MCHVCYRCVALPPQVNPPTGWTEKYYDALAARLCLRPGPDPTHVAGHDTYDSVTRALEGTGAGGSDVGPPHGGSGQQTVAAGIGGSRAGSEHLGSLHGSEGEPASTLGTDPGDASPEDEERAGAGGAGETVADGSEAGLEGARQSEMRAQGPSALLRYQSARVPQQPERMSLAELLRLLWGLERLSGLGAPPPAVLVASLQEALALHLAAAASPVPARTTGAAMRGFAPVAAGRPRGGSLGERRRHCCCSLRVWVPTSVWERTLQAAAVRRGMAPRLRRRCGWRRCWRAAARRTAVSLPERHRSSCSSRSGLPVQQGCWLSHPRGGAGCLGARADAAAGAPSCSVVTVSLVGIPARR